MKKIKLNFIGFWSGFDVKDNLFVRILSEKYVVEISEHPDFLFVSPLCKPYEYLKYDCIRILFAGEPLSPDFNVFDYAISFDYTTCLDSRGKDRHFRYPLCFYNYDLIVDKVKQGLTYSEAREALARKKYFCNFLYGHRSAYGEREKMLSIMETYKRVESAGSFMNNMPGGRIIPYSAEKMAFLEQCKFTIAMESVSRPGFCTEKIMDPIRSHSIPIYYGDPFSTQVFNSEAIINCHEFASIEEALERVKEIDQDDDLYIKMLMQPKMQSTTYLPELYNDFKLFLWRICDEEGEAAYRRLRHYAPRYHEQYLNNYRKLNELFAFKMLFKLMKER